MTEKVVRQLAERSVAAAEDTKKGMEHAYTTASKGAVDFSLQLIDMAQANMNAAFDFARQLSRVKSPSEFIELSTSHAREQLESLTEQTKHFTAAVQKATTDAAQPFQAGVAKTFNQTFNKST
jgi:phasin